METACRTMPTTTPTATASATTPIGAYRKQAAPRMHLVCVCVTPAIVQIGCPQLNHARSLCVTCRGGDDGGGYDDGGYDDGGGGGFDGGDE